MPNILYLNFANIVLTVIVCVQQFQELEELRIAYLRHQMWTLCNLCSQTTVYEDQVTMTSLLHHLLSPTPFSLSLVFAPPSLYIVI